MKANICVTTLFILTLLFPTQAKNNSNTSSAEILNVTHYDDLNASLPQEIKSKLALQKMSNGNYTTLYAKNNGEISLKNKKDTTTFILAKTTFENSFSTNTSFTQAPTTKNTVYELLSNNDVKESFSEIAFLDNNTVATISFTKQQASLLLIDISGSKMYVTSRINVPVDNIWNAKKNSSNRKELFYVDAATNKIILPVNNRAANIGKNGELTWKKSNTVTPGIWVITPTKNEEKKWMIAPSQIAVNYFTQQNITSKGKNSLLIQTAHADSKGNIWLSFTNGILGVLPIISNNTYAQQVNLYNFNKDVSWYDAMKKDYATLLYQDLKNSAEFESADSSNLEKRFKDAPDAFTAKYLENARYEIYSNILADKTSKLDSNATYENSDELWQYVSIELDNPLAKKKGKTVNYFGAKVKQFQTIQNSITSDNDGAVYVVTNLGLHKLTYNNSSNSIQGKWSLPYKNSFLKEFGNKVASSQTTPTYIEERNEIAFCDNDFPQINLMIIDAKTGAVKQKFRLFEYNVGSACNNAIAYSNNTIVVGNTFGNGYNSYVAKGVMKFYTAEKSSWRTDLDWNRLQVNTLSNTATPKIASNDDKTLVYQQADEEGKTFQLSAITINKVDKFNPTAYTLKPDFTSIKNKKLNINNQGSNYTFGPKKSVFIGTINGLMRITSE